MYRCPLKCLEQLARVLRPKAFPPAEEMVSVGAYGEEFILVLAGTVTVNDTAAPDDENVVRQVHDTDRDPIVGLAACLSDWQLNRVEKRTNSWTVTAGTYCDSVWVRRASFKQCLLDHWPEGREEMIEAAYLYYDVASLGKEETVAGEAVATAANRTESEPQPLLPVGLTEFVENK